MLCGWRFSGASAGETDSVNHNGCISFPNPNWLVDPIMFRHYGIYGLRPGAALQSEAQDWLITGLTRAMPQLKIASYFAVRRSTLSSSDHLSVAVAETSPQIVGFLSSRWFHEEAIGATFLHASICLISERYQRTLLFRHLWRAHLQQMSDGIHGFPYTIALKTYNPAVYHILSEFARLAGGDLFPRLNGAQDAATKRLVHAIGDRIAAGLEFDWETGVVRGAGVPPDFYPELPDHRRQDIYGYFRHNLRPGDRLLCVLTLPRCSRNRILNVLGATERDPMHGRA